MTQRRPVHVSKAEAEAMLGRTTSGEGEVAATSSPPRVRVRKTARGRYWTRCMTEGCGLEFHTAAAETRHVDETGHARYRVVIEEL